MQMNQFVLFRWLNTLSLVRWFTKAGIQKIVQCIIQYFCKFRKVGTVRAVGIRRANGEWGQKEEQKKKSTKNLYCLPQIFKASYGTVRAVDIRRD